MLLSLHPTVPLIPLMAKCGGVRKSSAARVQPHSLPWSGQMGDVVGQTPLLWHPSPDPPRGPRHSPSLPRSPGRQQDGLGRKADSSYCCQATQPRPKGQQPRVRPRAMAEQQLFAWEPWGPPLSLLGTAGFLTHAGEKGICLNKPKQTKPLKFFFFIPYFLTHKDSRVLPVWL